MRPLAGVRSARSLWLLLLVVLGGCIQQPATPLRVGILVWPPYEVAFLARNLGLLDEQIVKLVEYESPGALARAYRDGSVDAITVTADYLLMLAADAPNQRVVLAIDFSNGGDVIMARPPITRLEQIRGKRIAVEKSVLGAYVLHRALEQGGIDRNQVQIIPADVPDQAQAYARQTVDAVVTYEPTRTKLKQAGAHEVFSSKQIPGEVIDVLVTNTDVIAERGTALRAFISAWFSALDYLNAHPNDAARRVAAREGLTPDEFLDALTTVTIPDRPANMLLLSAGPKSMHETLRKHVQVMKRMGALRDTIPVDDLLDSQFVTPGPN